MQRRKRCKKLALPFYPVADTDDADTYDIPTYFEHLVHEYTGLNVNEIEELEYIDYLQYRRDAFIHHMNKTEKGQEYLRKAKIFGSTEPDRDTLRAHWGRKV